MKVSELVAELNGWQPDGHVVVREIDSVNIFFIESILKEAGKLPLLVARQVPSMGPPITGFPEAVFQQAFSSKRTSDQGTIAKSPVDGKYHLTVDGNPVMDLAFDSDAEAKIFLRGFVTGFSSARLKRSENIRR